MLPLTDRVIYKIMDFIKNLKAYRLLRIALAIIFIASGFIICALQFALWVIVRPWSLKLYRKINTYLTFSLHSQITFLMDWWACWDFQVFVDRDVLQNYMGKEHAFIVSNHGWEIEGFLVWALSDHLGMLGNLRGVARKTLCYVPILGWSWSLQEHILLERNWEKDKETLNGQLQNFMQYLQRPTWLTIFPEGTRFTEEKRQISMKVAAEKGLPELKHMLLPRTKGFVSCVGQLRERFAAVYDVTIVVDKDCIRNATFSALLRGDPLVFKMALRRFSTRDMPHEEQELAEWLHKRFYEKDQLMDNMLDRGGFNAFPERSNASSPLEMMDYLKAYEYVNIPKRIHSLVNVTTWAVIIYGILMRFFWVSLFTGSYFQLCLLVGGIMAASYFLEKVIDVSRSISATPFGHKEEVHS